MELQGLPRSWPLTAGAADFWEGVVLQADVLLPPSVSSLSADWMSPHASLTRDSISAASGQRKHSRNGLRRCLGDEVGLHERELCCPGTFMSLTLLVFGLEVHNSLESGHHIQILYIS